MILKIIIGIVVYILILALICIFLKGATKNEREFEERQEYERIMKELEKEEGNREIVDADIIEEENIRDEIRDERKIKRP